MDKTKMVISSSHAPDSSICVERNIQGYGKCAYITSTCDLSEAIKLADQFGIPYESTHTFD